MNEDTGGTVLPRTRRALASKNRVAALFLAQDGRCFHCTEPMADTPHPMMRNGWTREHVYPRARYRRMGNNVVLAHAECNSAKGGRPPTPEEVEKARLIYGLMGLEAFVSRPAGYHEGVPVANGGLVAKSAASEVVAVFKVPIAERVIKAYWHDGEIVRIKQREG